jgi:hypothetical protein
MSTPKNLEHADGWYLNANKSQDGSPVELYNGWGTMAAGDCVFYTAGERFKSGDAFVAALASGLLKGPFSSKGEAVASGATAKVETKKPAPPAELTAPPAPVAQPAPAAEDPLAVDEDEEKPAPKVEVKKPAPAKK